MQLIQLEAVSCVVLHRVNRFVVEVSLADGIELAYLNNTGRLESYLSRGRRGYCIRHPGGRTSLRLFAVEDGGLAVILDTRLQMRAFERAAGLRLLPWMSGCVISRRAPKLGSSRLDYLLDCDGRAVYLEAKSAVMRKGFYALYPDCPTARGRRHIAELASHVEAGGMGTLLFIAAVPYARAFRPNCEADPMLCRLLSRAVDAGVAVKAIGIYYSPVDSCIHLYNPDLRVELPT